MKIEKFTDVCVTEGMHYTPSQTNVCKFFKFDLFEFSAAILEKGLLMLHKSIRTNTHLGYLSASIIKFSIPAFLDLRT